jgi:hypothetical protein
VGGGWAGGGLAAIGGEGVGGGWACGGGAETGGAGAVEEAPLGAEGAAVCARAEAASRIQTHIQVITEWIGRMGENFRVSRRNSHKSNGVTGSSKLQQTIPIR